MADNRNKPVLYCPFCASNQIRKVKGIDRCEYCQTVFIVSYQRPVRAAPKKDRQETTNV